MYIPHILRMHRILGKNRKEPCKCGHFHKSKEIYLGDVTSIEYMDMLVTLSKWEMEELSKQLILPYMFGVEEIPNSGHKTFADAYKIVDGRWINVPLE